MTSPYVAFPRQPQPAPRRSTWPVFRVILAVAAVAGGTLAYVIAGFIAVFTWTGCFIGCTGENRAGGAALGLLACALLAAGPGLVAVLYRSRVWLTIAGIAAAGGGALILLLIAGN
jgi:hypothetical protein